MIRRSRRVAGVIGLAMALCVLVISGPTTEDWAGITLLFTGAVLMLAVVGAICRVPRDRPGLLGFAVFGSGYFLLARWYTYHQGPMPTVAFVPGAGTIHGDPLSLPPMVRIAHDLWTLAFAILGSLIAATLAKRPAANAHPVVIVPGWRGASVALGLLGVVLLSAWWFDPEIGAGAVYLLAWAVVGLAILGAALARGRRRATCFGAAAFGLGYLVLAFGPLTWPQIPTHHLVNAVFRPGGPTSPGDPKDRDHDDDEESRRIAIALDTPISIHFREPTPLTVVLESIKQAVRPALGGPLREFAAVGKSGAGPLVPPNLIARRVTIDRDRIPAKEALRLCLGQVGLTYRVRSGYVRIFPDVYQPTPIEEDPAMIAGHSLLAMIAATFGALAGPLVARSCARIPVTPTRRASP